MWGVARRGRGADRVGRVRRHRWESLSRDHYLAADDCPYERGIFSIHLRRVIRQTPIWSRISLCLGSTNPQSRSFASPHLHHSPSPIPLAIPIYPIEPPLHHSQISSSTPSDPPSYPPFRLSVNIPRHTHRPSPHIPSTTPLGPHDKIPIDSQVSRPRVPALMTRRGNRIGRWPPGS